MEPVLDQFTIRLLNAGTSLSREATVKFYAEFVKESSTGTACESAEFRLDCIVGDCRQQVSTKREVELCDQLWGSDKTRSDGINRCNCWWSKGSQRSRAGMARGAEAHCWGGSAARRVWTSKRKGALEGVWHA